MKYLRYILLIILLLLLWFCSMVQLTTLVSYHHCFTAGELLAWVTANPYEVSDIADYCMRYVLPYWVLCSLLMLLIGVGMVLFVRKTGRKGFVITLSIELLLLLPFTALPIKSNLLKEALAVASQINNINAHRSDSSDFTYNAYRNDDPDRPEIYVLAIGESLRYNNLSINGEYARQTTPLLEQTDHLCLFSNCFANATLTQHAMPMLLTPAGADTFLEHFNYKTIPAAFSQAGFSTALISHQAQLMNNGLHSYLAQDFDTIVFVKHDSLIAPAMREIADKHNKLFITTHYWGNHIFYDNLTDDCKQWLPDYLTQPEAKSDSLFLNAYDNSVLYTDRLLSEFINTLNNTNTMSCLLFVSDHGEYIGTHVSGHGYTYHPTKDEYHIPLLVWYSEQYGQTYPNKIDNLIKHKDEPVSADHIFWSVLDMADIRINSNMQQQDMSVFGDILQPYQRTLLLPDGKQTIEI